jgi:hypothetical protein
MQLFANQCSETPVILKWKVGNIEEDDKKEELVEGAVNDLSHEKHVISDQKENLTHWNQDCVLVQSTNNLSSDSGSNSVAQLTSCVVEKVTQLNQLRMKVVF